MKEDNFELGPDTSFESTSARNGLQFEIDGLSRSIRPQTMASQDGRKGSLSGRPRRSRKVNTKTALLSILAASPVAMAETCISLSGSTQCPAFSSASISTDSTLVGFLYGYLHRRNAYLIANLLIVHSCNTFPVSKHSTRN